MTSYENITRASTPQVWSQSITHERENTKQSNANPILKWLWCLLEMLGLHLCVRKSKSETKTGNKHNSISNNKR